MGNIFRKYTNTVDGLQAVITEGNHAHDFRAILKDTDAGEIVAVTFGTFEQCYNKAVAFVGDPNTEEVMLPWS